jgi:ankyrin repeat protein
MGWTALHIACVGSHTGVVEELLEGAGREEGFVAITKTDCIGSPALHYTDKEQILNLLLAAATRMGAKARHDLVFWLSYDGENILHWHSLQFWFKVCSEEELEVLLPAKNKKGHNPLHHAARWRNPRDARMLLRGVREWGWKGGKEQEWRNSLGDDGMTALHLAIAFPRFPTQVARGEETVRSLLCPLVGEGEAEERATRKKRRQHAEGEEDDEPQDLDEDDAEEERERVERLRFYVGGLDPNTMCTKRTMVCNRLEP